MSHMQNFDVVDTHLIENFVRVPPDDLDVNALTRRALGTQRVFSNLRDCIVYGIDALRAPPGLRF